MFSPRIVARLESMNSAKDPHVKTTHHQPPSGQDSGRAAKSEVVPESLKRRSRSLDDLKVRRQRVASGVRERRPSEQVPAVPRRSSQRPNIEQLMLSQCRQRKASSHKHSQSVDRVEFARPKLHRARAEVGFQTTPALKDAQHFPKQEVGDIARTRKSSRPIIETGEEVAPPVPEKDPRSPGSRTLDSPHREKHIASQIGDKKPLPRLLASKYHRSSERPSPSSVEVHLDDLLQGLEEQLSTERAALPILRSMAQPSTPCVAGA